MAGLQFNSAMNVMEESFQPTGRVRKWLEHINIDQRSHQTATQHGKEQVQKMVYV